MIEASVEQDRDPITEFNDPAHDPSANPYYDRSSFGKPQRGRGSLR